ncbi:MAG: glutamate-1-semialdehyde 2,1-aminomutase [Promethearchaeota archaeon]
MTREISMKLYERATRFMPGGVNSPVRAFTPFPFFTAKARGSKLYDVDGNQYVDYCLAYGPLILGHAHPRVVATVRRQLDDGWIFGTPNRLELELAEKVHQHFPSVEMCRLVNSGTEATMHAVRLARGFTGREKILKFEGCYHGAHDHVLVEAGSGAATFGSPTSLGIPKAAAERTLVTPYNDVERFKAVMDQHGEEVAAVIVEPVAGNCGLVLPATGFLQTIARVAKEKGALTIFDEVITGFRLAPGGAQEKFGVQADLTTLGKVLGGGFPLAAYGGRRDLMEHVSPLGKVYQASTLSGNPACVAAGLATLEVLEAGGGKLYSKLEGTTARLAEAIRKVADEAGVQVVVNQVGSMFQAFFTGHPVTDYATASAADREAYREFHANMLDRGVFLPPSQFETCFTSIAHSAEDVDATAEAARQSFLEVAKRRGGDC